MLFTVLWLHRCWRGREGAMAPAPLSAGFQSLLLLPTIKLGPSGADSRVAGLVHALDPSGSLQWTLLRGWKFLLLLHQPPQVFSIRGLMLYFPALEPAVVRSALLPAIPTGLSGVQMLGRRVCQPLPSIVCCLQLVLPLSTNHHLTSSTSCHLGANPLCPGYASLPLLLVWMNVSSLSPGCWTSIQFDFLSVLVVFCF